MALFVDLWRSQKVLRGYKLLTLMIWFIQPIKEEIFTYTPGTSFRPQPNPQDTNPVNS